MNTVYGIYGASGFGKEILSLVKEQFGCESKIVFVDDVMFQMNFWDVIF